MSESVRPILHAMLAACVLLPQAWPAQTDAAILERDPASLPRAEVGRWRDWNARTPPPAEAREELLKAVSTYETGRLVESLGWLYAALERAPDFPAALHQLGVVYFRLRRYGDAVTAFERFLQLSPEEVSMTRALGHAYYSLGRYEDARAHYGFVLAVRPEMIEALRGRALAYYRLGEPVAALEVLDRVIELVPGYADARTWRAQVLFDEERLEEALEEAARARDEDPFPPRAWFLLAQIHFELGQDEEGEAARARFLELDRVHQEVRTLEGRLLLEPAQPDLLKRLAVLHSQVGDPGRTRDALERLVRGEKESFEAQLFALDLLEAMGDGPGAASAALFLERRHPRVPETWKRLRDYYGRTGDRMKQVQAGERFLRMTEKD